MIHASLPVWSSADIAKAVNVPVNGAWVAKGVTIDSRDVQKGDLFIAIHGDKQDGHMYAKAAFDKGAAAVMVDHLIEGIPAENQVVVSDTFAALQTLGQAARMRTAARIVGVTGSVGKTGTKDMMIHLLSTLGPTHGSVKSFNNHWGVPLTLARMQAGSDFGVFEMGMDHAGEITPLSLMVKPHIAIITTVASSHIENFADGIEGIAKAKAEIFNGMDAHGIAILNRDNDFFDFLRSAAQTKGLRKILSFGRHAEADARLDDILIASNGIRAMATILGEPITFTLKDAGEHNAMNALSVLLAYKILGGNMQDAIAALRDIEPPAGRGKREYLDVGDAANPVTLIDESYNASSAVAMQAAFKVLALIDPGRGGRRIAILGDMYEQGKNAAAIHRELALPLQAAGVDLVYTCGPLMKNLYDALPANKQGAHRDESPELAQIVPEVLVPGDVVMVKGSRGGGDKPRMQVIVEALREMPKRAKNTANAQRQERN